MYVRVHTRIALYLQDGLASPSADLVFTLPLPTKHQICRFKAFQRRHGGQVLSPPRDKSPARRASPDGGCRVKQKKHDEELRDPNLWKAYVRECPKIWNMWHSRANFGHLKQRNKWQSTCQEWLISTEFWNHRCLPEQQKTESTVCRKTPPFPIPAAMSDYPVDDIPLISPLKKYEPLVKSPCLRVPCIPINTY